MRDARRALVLLLGLAVAAWPALADEAASDRRALEEVRKDPERDARLRADVDAFLRLPADERARLRQLDRDLKGLEPHESERLRHVLERYAVWLEALPEPDRVLILSAPDREERLRRIKTIRRRQWEASLPKAYRDRLAATTGAEREALVDKYRREESQHRREWQFATRHWDEMLRGQLPRRAQDFNNPALQTFVSDYLMPRLSKDDAERLREAEGHWPQYPQTLVELADKHPLLVPGPWKGPTEFKELPEDVRQALKKLTPWQRLRLAAAEGRWPDYGVRVVEVARAAGVTLPRPLGPCRPDEFAPAIRRFIESDLTPVLGPEEKSHLAKAEGHWPQYPRVLARLAHKHRLQVPGSALPGPADYWNRFRSHAPEGDRAASGP